jgi:Xaa-Pro aminopeptidase
MFLSRREKERRYERLREAMAKEDMGALLVVGNLNATGSPFYATGSFRYLTDFFIFSQYGILLFFREKDPIMLVPMEIQETFARKHSWIDDVRISLNYAETVCRLLEERGLARGRVGVVSMESLPAATCLSLQKRLPKLKLLDATTMLLALRFVKGEEERRLMEKAAALNDGAYREVLGGVRPGMKEYEVAGILEGYHRGHGSDKTFNLVFSGPFPRSKEGVPFEGLPWCPGQREIEKGDCVHLEMTTVYGGYWNQLVRIISVGAENDELARFHQAAVLTIGAGVKAMRVGAKTPNFVHSMAMAAESSGFKLITPMGHFVGLDLIEARVDGESQIVLEAGVSLILHPRLDDSEGTRIVLWGETYFITEEGPIRLNRTDDTLHTVSC